jgi:hypothetical protein
VVFSLLAGASHYELGENRLADSATGMNARQMLGGIAHPRFAREQDVILHRELEKQHNAFDGALTHE